MKVVVIAAIVLSAAVVVLYFGAASAPVATGVASLVAFWFLWSSAAGSLGWAATLHLTGGTWHRPLRPAWEAGWPLWPLAAIAALIAGSQAAVLFPWAGAASAADLGHLLDHRATWNGHWPLAGRTGLSLVLAGGLAVLLWRRARRRPDETWPRLAAGGVLVVAITSFITTIDWLFATTPHFHSSVLSLVQIMAGVQASLAAVICWTWWVWRRRQLAVRAVQWRALGSLLVACSCLWAYLHLSQALVINMSDRPHRAGWWLQHTGGAWAWIGLGLVLVRFLVPFLFLLMRRWREQPHRLFAIALAILPAQALEALWWVAPSAGSASAAPGWRDGVALLAAVAAMVLVFSRQPLSAAMQRGAR